MRGRAGRLRVILLGLGMVGTLAMAITPQGNGLAVPVFLIALAAEIVGRWQFYASRAPGHF
jgi:DMSO reductase anchor subunit